MRADYADARRIGAAARACFAAVFEGWQGPRLSTDARAIETSVEAQIAASSLGHKPLYYDPWPAEASDQLAESLRPHLPAGVVVARLPSGLVVYRPEVLRPILDADPYFYRPNDEDDLAAIERVCASGDNGELLGYGARNWWHPQGAKVTIADANQVIFVFFVSDPSHAEHFAFQRLSDIASYTGEAMTYTIESGEGF